MEVVLEGKTAWDAAVAGFQAPPRRHGRAALKLAGVIGGGLADSIGERAREFPDEQSSPLIDP
jgi:hypothetical protein